MGQRGTPLRSISNVYTLTRQISRASDDKAKKTTNAMAAKSDTKKKAGKKSGQLVIRIDPAERDAFVQLCDRLDTSAAREIRHFMRRFVKEHGDD